ncbi:MAG: hypothetical protein KJ646_01570 [Nanoarchaeota archaeon]|nr:hypothetical protein [Nanoarchaeota archaeon]MBU4116692.1 hypothetical protein [Nanoarchaeota archaeon]
MASDRLVYEDLHFPTYVNSRTAMVLGYNNGKEDRVLEVPVSEVMKAVELAGGSVLNVGDTRTGKSQAMMDIHRHHFGGDADSGGRANWIVARNDFTADGYYMTIDQSKYGEGNGMLSEARVPVEKRVKALATSVDEINLAIPEMQVEYFGIGEGRHRDIELGEEGYFLFQASCNMNRVNGDFAGTSKINRALLNRIMVTIDHDRYRRTDEDDDVLSERTASGRLNLAPIRDISGKILSVHNEIKKASSKREPWSDAYLRILSSGLDYCEKDKDKLKKRAWPIRCGDCDFSQKDLCSLVKHSNTGTVGALKRFMLGTDYLMKLKHGNISIDPLDLMLESFKFTTYHGNLNEIEINSRYYGEDQELMEDVVDKLREKIEPVKKYIDLAVDNAFNNNLPELRFIDIGAGQDKKSIVYSQENLSKLDKIKSQGKQLEFRVVAPFDNFASDTGIRMDWLKGYLESLGKSRVLEK